MIFARLNVTNPVHFHGAAEVFEGQFLCDVMSSGKVIQRDQVTVRDRVWSLTLTLPLGKHIVRFYNPSAKNGSPTDIHDFPVNVLS